VDVGGAHVPHLLTEGNKPLTLPVQVTGTCFAPVTNYGAVPEALGKVAMNNVAAATTGKVKSAAAAQVQQQISKVNAPPAVKNAVQGLGKKLFGK
jgi:hypothetical protein